jgi:hypothetical protein
MPPKVLNRDRSPAATAPAARSRARPVLLATLGVRVDPSAERMALESSLHAGAPLILANLSMMPPYPTTMMLAREYATLPHEEDLDAVRATAKRAAALGIATELLRITSRHPLKALVELSHERDAGLLVFGPDLGRISRVRFALAARAVRRNASCLVWIAPDG